MATQPASLLHISWNNLARQTHARLVQGTCDKIFFCVFFHVSAVLVKCAGFDSSQGTEFPSADTSGVPGGEPQPWTLPARLVLLVQPCQLGWASREVGALGIARCCSHRLWQVFGDKDFTA